MKGWEATMEKLKVMAREEVRADLLLIYPNGYKFESLSAHYYSSGENDALLTAF